MLELQSKVNKLWDKLNVLLDEMNQTSGELVKRSQSITQGINQINAVVKQTTSLRNSKVQNSTPSPRGGGLGKGMADGPDMASITAAFTSSSIRSLPVTIHSNWEKRRGPESRKNSTENTEVTEVARA